MQSTRENYDKISDHQKKLRGCKSEENYDLKLLKEIENSNTKRLKEISDALIKETRLKISDARKSHNIIAMAREEVNTTTQHSVLDMSKMTSKLLKLPSLTHTEKPQRSVSDSVNQSTMRLQRFNTNPQNLPLFSINNTVSRAGYKSRVGYVKGKPKLHNEDSIIIQAHLQKVRGQYLFAVSDGHGISGHAISEFIKECFPNVLQHLLPVEPRVEQIQAALTMAVEKTEDSLKQSNIDRMFSGATLISVLICGNLLVCTSLGDCKAYLYSLGQKWETLPLHSTHTLKNKTERKRMIKNNARIAVEVDEQTNEVLGTEKAYMNSDDTPGLEITRSIGDKIGKYIGIIATPENKVHQLTPDDKFLIIGSTGFWKVICENDALQIVRNSWEEKQIEKACEDLIAETDRRWKKSGKDKEDVSVIVVFLMVN